MTEGIASDVTIATHGAHPDRTPLVTTVGVTEIETATEEGTEIIALVALSAVVPLEPIDDHPVVTETEIVTANDVAIGRAPLMIGGDQNETLTGDVTVIETMIETVIVIVIVTVAETPKVHRATETEIATRISATLHARTGIKGGDFVTIWMLSSMSL